eukprot:TRINITY_DN31561_c0_g1_i2.p1 TRINITY_DN31561_c0_g1~~TRINITY_DN31561_c0_g1_i2.p1  ORF type:complete len:779 (+),score=83.05 TRINITY_DN31561_c0_g1_i2:329-2338(+)
MVERSKVLMWARGEPPLAVPADVGCGSGSGGRRSRTHSDLFHRYEKQDSIHFSLPDESDGVDDPLGPLELPPTMMGRRVSSGNFSVTSDENDEVMQRLDEVEERAEFWCKLVSASGAAQVHKDVAQAAEKLHREGDQAADLYDLRENLLEKLFDLSPERLKEVYDIIDKDSDGRILKDELREGLHRCGMFGFDEAVERVLQEVSTHENGSLDLAEFESVLTRLKLAQLLSSSASQQHALSDRLKVTDYNVSQAVDLKTEKLLDYFFGHRSKDFPMRWVHVGGFDLTLLLALTIKYQLHPLSVEDVIDQSPTRVDRYGAHYFAAIEHLCLNSAGSGQEPVRVLGRHVTIFCAGLPHQDTVITIAQADRSLQDWHEDTSPRPGHQVDAWVGRLQKRLRAVRSRTRERKADFLMYEIIDLCTDDLVRVTKAYAARLIYLERCLQEHRLSTEQRKMNWFNEVGLVKLQLAVVSRRLRGMQRILRRLHDDADFSAGLFGYLQDVADHVTESYEDAGHLSEKCSGLIAAYEHWEDRMQDMQHQQATQQQTLADERMNRMLFVLTVLTTIFTPLTFGAGVYGMNFQGPDGKPSIPELLWPDGYFYFWVVTIIYLLVASCCGVALWRSVIGRSNRSSSASFGGAGSVTMSQPHAALSQRTSLSPRRVSVQQEWVPLV